MNVLVRQKGHINTTCVFQSTHCTMFFSVNELELKPRLKLQLVFKQTKLFNETVVFLTKSSKGGNGDDDDI